MNSIVRLASCNKVVACTLAKSNKILQLANNTISIRKTAEDFKGTANRLPRILHVADNIYYLQLKHKSHCKKVYFLFMLFQYVMLVQWLASEATILNVRGSIPTPDKKQVPNEKYEKVEQKRRSIFKTISKDLFKISIKDV